MVNTEVVSYILLSALCSAPALWILAPKDLHCRPASKLSACNCRVMLCKNSTGNLFCLSLETWSEDNDCFSSLMWWEAGVPPLCSMGRGNVVSPSTESPQGLLHCLWLCWALLPARWHQCIMEMGTGFQPDRFFPFFLLIWRKWAGSDGAPWELAWIYDGLSCLLLGWTGKGVSGAGARSDHWGMEQDAVAQQPWSQGCGIRLQGSGGWGKGREGCRVLRHSGSIRRKRRKKKVQIKIENAKEGKACVCCRLLSFCSRQCHQGHPLFHSHENPCHQYFSCPLHESISS